jgi:hypothetical protein
MKPCRITTGKVTRNGEGGAIDVQSSDIQPKGIEAEAPNVACDD